MPEDVRDVQVGTLIALMVDEGQDYKDVEIPKTATEEPSTPSDPETDQSSLR